MASVVGKNIFSLAFSRILSGVILFFVYVRLANYLGPDGFGRFSLVLAFYFIFYLLVDVGMSKYVIKRVSEDKNLGPQYLGNFLALEGAISLAVLGAFILIPAVLGYDVVLSRSMLLAGAGLLFGSFAIAYSSVVQAWQKIHLVAGINFTRTLVNAAWLAAAIIFRESLIFIFWGYIVMGILETALYIIVTRKFIRPKFDLQKELIKKMLLMGLPFGFISGFEILIGKIDVVIQKAFLPFFEVGLYSAAYRFLDILTFVPAIVSVSLFPYLAEGFYAQSTGLDRTAGRINRYLAGLAIPLGVGVTIIPDKIILSLFDEQYLGSVLPFQILIWSTVLTFLYAVPNVVMLVKKTWTAAGILGVVTLANIILNIIFVPRYGIIASAWITVGSYALIAAFYFAMSRRFIEVSILKYFPKVLAGTAVMAVALVYLEDLHVFLLVPAAILIYTASLFVLKFFEREDWLYIRGMFKN